MNQEPRAQEVEYRKKVYSAKNDPAAEGITMLLDMNIERLKATGLKCSKDELERLQGEAAAYVRVRRWIHEPIDNK